MTDPVPVVDRIVLEGLRAKGFHGVFDHERRDGQEFVVDAVLELDTRAAAASDDLADTVDYGALAQGLAEVVRGEPVDLIERLAARLADRCLLDPRVRAATVRVHKPSAPIAESFTDVAVEIRRAATQLLLEPVTAVLALGANLGDRAATLQSAVDALAGTEGVVVTGVSAPVRTAPVGGPEQPDYCNAVVQVRTRLTAAALLRRCLAIEADHGRTREIRWGARTLDIDVITYGALACVTAELQVPHPRVGQRAFVLVPWAQLDPDAVLPGPDGGRVAELADRAPDRAGVSPWPGPALVAPV